MEVQKQKFSKIKKFLKPTWKKQVLSLVGYFCFGSVTIKFFSLVLSPLIKYFLSRLANQAWILFSLFIFFSFALFYLLSCLIFWKFFKRDRIRKIRIWEITMFIGIILGCSPLGFWAEPFIYPIYPLLKFLFPDFLILQAEGGLWWRVEIGGVILGAVIGILVGVIASLIIFIYNKLKK